MCRGMRAHWNEALPGPGYKVEQGTTKSICRAIYDRPNLCAARACALAASSSRFFGAAVDWSEDRSRSEILATSSTAPKNAASFTFDGVLKPLIFLTNCSEAARISDSVTGGSKLNRVLMFLHMSLHLFPTWHKVNEFPNTMRD